jgi:hypothetical protein
LREAIETIAKKGAFDPWVIQTCRRSHEGPGVLHLDKNGKVTTEWEEQYYAGDAQACSTEFGHDLEKVDAWLSNLIDIDTEAGKTVYLRWSVHVMGYGKLEVVDDATGANDLRKLRP